MILPILKDKDDIIKWASLLVNIIAQELDSLRRPKSQITTTFTTNDGKTVTIKNGIITNVS